jgi:hypothetical protein
MARQHGIAGFQKRDAFDRVAQFSDVSGPVVVLQQLPRGWGEGLKALAEDGDELVEEGLRQRRYITGALPERGQVGSTPYAAKSWKSPTIPGYPCP